MRTIEEEMQSSLGPMSIGEPITNEEAKEFSDWVCKQKPNEKIDHTNGWESCAIGEFLAFRADCKVKHIGYSEAGAFAVATRDYWPDTYAMMNVGVAHNAIATYGGLCKTLSDENSTGKPVNDQGPYHASC